MRLIIGLIAGFIMLFPHSLPGQAVTTSYTGTSIPIGPPTDWGTIECAGGRVLEWPALTQPPCSEGTERILARGLVQEYSMITDDPRMIGFETVTSNVNADGWTPFGPGSGQIWGTVTIYVTDGGAKTGEVWEGIWRGTRTVTEANAVSVMQAVVHGRGGRIDGLSAHYDIVIDMMALPPRINGVIIDPGGARRPRLTAR